MSSFDRTAHLRKDLDFLEARLSAPSTRLLPVWREQHVLAGDALLLPSLREGAALLDDGGELVFLGMYDAAACFAIDVSRIASPLSHRAISASAAATGREAELADVRFALGRLDAVHGELSFYASALLNWHARAQFCGVCGDATKPRDGGHLRVCARASCATEHFPRTDPCVLVIVSDAERVLLGRQAAWPRGMYSALAGFVEPGETLEQAVAREVLEEAGIELEPSSIRYAGSQAWPFPASLMIGFEAHAKTNELRFGDELEDARWVALDALNDTGPDFFVPPPHTLSGRLISEHARRKARETLY